MGLEKSSKPQNLPWDDEVFICPDLFAHNILQLCMPNINNAHKVSDTITLCNNGKCWPCNGRMCSLRAGSWDQPLWRWAADSDLETLFLTCTIIAKVMPGGFGPWTTTKKPLLLTPGYAKASSTFPFSRCEQNIIFLFMLFFTVAVISTHIFQLCQPTSVTAVYGTHVLFLFLNKWAIECL